MTTSCDLTKKHCVPCEGGIPALTDAEIQTHLTILSGWTLDNKGRITKTWNFKDFHETMAFVNAVAWVSHQEGHHPDLEVGYNKCVVCYETHAVSGLTENDFICAMKVEQLFL